MIYRERNDGEINFVYLDSLTGGLLRVETPESRSTGDTILRWFGWLHFGNFARGTAANFWVKGLWLILGLAPGLLAITGFLMYWNRNLGKKWAKLGEPKSRRSPRAARSLERIET
jgi:uncharacterized iron-regulated membrane protein